MLTAHSQMKGATATGGHQALKAILSPSAYISTTAERQQAPSLKTTGWATA